MLFLSVLQQVLFYIVAVILLRCEKVVLDASNVIRGPGIHETV